MLRDNACVPCEVGAPTVSDDELEKYIMEVPDWEVVEDGGIKKLKRVFKFEDFAKALYFVDRVGAIAEEQGHHPKLVIEWGRVEVWWWTHKIQGLHHNDFVMAAKSDEIFTQSVE